MKKNKVLLIVLTGFTAAAFTAFFFSRNIPEIGKSSVPYQLDSAIKRAGNYLQTQIQPNGQFIYWVDLNPKRKLNRKYNILRHMGALYSLKMLEDYKPGSIDKAKVKKSLLFIKDQTFSPIDEERMGVWSSEAFSGRKGMPDQVKLGAAGLVLVGMCGHYDLIKEEVSLDTLEKIGNFIVSMQKEDGGFYSKFLKESGPDASWVSLYYPGEAAFGLVELYKLTKNEKYLTSAVKAMDFLYQSRKEKAAAQVEADHWALIATDKILSLGTNIENGVKERLLSHGEQIVRKILIDRVVSHQVDFVIGAFHEWGKTTPTATRVEGLTAFYPHIKDQELKAITKESIFSATDFLLEAQVDGGVYDGSWTRSVIKLEGTSKDIKSHNRRRKEIRIDYVQHAMSALINAKLMSI